MKGLKSNPIDDRIVSRQAEIAIFEPYIEKSNKDNIPSLYLDTNILTRLLGLRIDPATFPIGAFVHVASAVAEKSLTDCSYLDLDMAIQKLEDDFIRRTWMPSPDFVSALTEHVRDNLPHHLRGFAVRVPYIVAAEKISRFSSYDMAKEKFLEIFNVPNLPGRSMALFSALAIYSRKRQNELAVNGDFGSSLAGRFEAFLAYRRTFGSDNALTKHYLINKCADCSIWHGFWDGSFWRLNSAEHRRFPTHPLVASSDKMLQVLFGVLPPSVETASDKHLPGHLVKVLGMSPTESFLGDFLSPMMKLQASTHLSSVACRRALKSLYREVKSLCTAAESDVLDEVWDSWFLAGAAKPIVPAAGYGFDVFAFPHLDIDTRYLELMRAENRIRRLRKLE